MSYHSSWRCAMRPTGSPEELERRRLRALALLKQGLLPSEVARRVGVNRRSVRRWKSVARRHGEAGERDEAGIQRWVHETWPQVKKTPAAAARRSSSSTKQGS